MSFVERAIDVTVTLGEGSFGLTGSNTVTLSGYRASVQIAKNGIPSMNSAQIRIYGMSLSLMNQLSRVGMVPDAYRNNIVSVMAGDSEAGMSLAFAGGIMDAWADFQAAPEVAFNISAFTGQLAAMKTALPSSYPGPTDVAVIMATLAKTMGYTFENNGVSVILASPYLPGTARAQAIAAAEAANIFLILDDDNGILAIMPRDGARGTPVPLISPATGMVGYPVYSGPGTISLKTLYNPAIRFGGNVQVDSSVTPAVGLWNVVQLSHSLESQMPNGDWFTDIIGNVSLAKRAPKSAAA